MTADTPASRIRAEIDARERTEAELALGHSRVIAYGNPGVDPALTVDDLRAVLDEHEQLRAEPRASCHLCRVPLGIVVCSDCATDLAAEGARQLAEQKAAACVCGCLPGQTCGCGMDEAGG